MRLHPRPFPDFAVLALTLALALFALAGPPLHAQPGSGPISGGGGGGGLPGASEVTESMLKVVNACTDEYVLTCETGGGGDFEWQPPATGDVVGPASATDNAITVYDSTTGKLVKNSAVTVAPTTGNLQWEGTTANDFEGNFTIADPTVDWTCAWSATGQISCPLGTSLLPTYSFGADTDSGFYSSGSDVVGLALGGGLRYEWYTDGMQFYNGVGIIGLGNSGNTIIGMVHPVEANTAGSGAPNVLLVGEARKVLTNEGTTAANYHTLPLAASGLSFTFCAQDADGLRIVANTSDTMRVIDKVTAAAGYIESTTIGSCWSGVAINAVEWFTTSITGTWTDGTFTYDDTSLTAP